MYYRPLTLSQQNCLTKNTNPTAIGQLHEKLCNKEQNLNLLTNSPKILNDTMIYLKIQTFTTLI